MLSFEDCAVGPRVNLLIWPQLELGFLAEGTELQGCALESGRHHGHPCLKKWVQEFLWENKNSEDRCWLPYLTML